MTPTYTHLHATLTNQQAHEMLAIAHESELYHYTRLRAIDAHHQELRLTCRKADYEAWCELVLLLKTQNYPTP